jgi:hypothetical protein
VLEPGLDLHEWETRWQELEDAFAEAPEETLSEMGRFLEQALQQRGFQLDEPVTLAGEDPDIVRQFLGARQLTRIVETGNGTEEDVQDAVEAYREIYAYLHADRAAP